jgi:hypothetical protein
MTGTTHEDGWKRSARIQALPLDARTVHHGLLAIEDRGLADAIHHRQRRERLLSPPHPPLIVVRVERQGKLRLEDRHPKRLVHLAGSAPLLPLDARDVLAPTVLLADRLRLAVDDVRVVVLGFEVANGQGPRGRSAPSPRALAVADSRS